MSLIKKHKKAVIAAVFIAAVLAAAYFFGGTTDDAPVADNAAVQTDNGETNAPSEQDEPIADGGETKSADRQDENSTAQNDDKIKYSEGSGMKIDENTGMDEHNTEPVPVGKPTPVEPQAEQITDTELTCSLSVRCDTAAGRTTDKMSVIPSDGIIFPEQQVVFYDGESVFNVLVREMKKNKIHLEFVNTPIYNSAYIEGIGNLYEFDCGELSGWMYRVNGWFPNYGCSRYEIKSGDKIEWVYTCDLGKDVGGGYSARNGAKNE